MNIARIFGISMAILFLYFVPNVLGETGKSEIQTKFEKAKEAFKAKNLEKAGELVLFVLMKKPSNFEFRFLFGQILFEKGDLLSAKENFEIVRNLPFFLGENKQKHESINKKIDEMQDFFDAAGEKELQTYWKNQSTKEPFELATTLFKAFRLAPKLMKKYPDELKKTINVYESILEGSFEGDNWKPSAPMMQLAFLYSQTREKRKAVEIYRNTIGNARDPNEESVIAYKHDNLSSVVGHLYSPEAYTLKTVRRITGNLYPKDFFDTILGSDCWDKISEEDRKKVFKIIDDATQEFNDESTLDECDIMKEKIKTRILEKQKRGELPGYEQRKNKLKMEDSQ